MPKHLIIAEKPSVAADIARTLGGFTKHADYFESDRYVLSSAVGHLLEMGSVYPVGTLVGRRLDNLLVRELPKHVTR